MHTRCHVYAYFLEGLFPLLHYILQTNGGDTSSFLSINSTDTAGTLVEGAANSVDQKLSSLTDKPCRSPSRTEDQKNR